MTQKAQIGTYCFRDFDDYSGSIDDVNARSRVFKVVEESWTLSQFILGDSWRIQTADEQSGHIAEGMLTDGGLALFLQCNPHSTRVNGQAARPDSAIVMPYGKEFCYVDKLPHQWMAVVLSHEACASLLGPGFLSQPGFEAVGVIGGAERQVRNLWLLASRLMLHARARPGLLDSPLALSLADRALTSGFGHVLGGRTTIVSGALGRPRRISRPKLDRAIEFIEERPYCWARMSELSDEVGVPERTLRAAFRTHFGMSPSQFMQTRRLQRARKLLKAQRNPRGSVSQVATELGFWDLGRFAGRYRREFGEYPSETLARTRKRFA